MIEATVRRWHEYVASDSTDGLDELLADDVVFCSPIIFTPQVGKPLTTMYLTAAKRVFAGDGAEFRYVREVLSGDTAVLEFETSIGGKYVNGVDIIRCNPAGQITEFKVMIRPLQAITAVHEQMRAMIESLQP